MISYEPLYKTMKEKGVSTYKLVNDFGISSSLLDRLKHNKILTFYVAFWIAELKIY